MAAEPISKTAKGSRPELLPPKKPATGNEHLSDPLRGYIGPTVGKITARDQAGNIVSRAVAEYRHGRPPA
jgi:hypothetical protein